MPNIDVVARGTIDDRGQRLSPGHGARPTARWCARTATPAGSTPPVAPTGHASTTTRGPGPSKERCSAATADPPTSNFLKLSRSVDGNVLYAYGARSRQVDDTRFGERASEAIFCTSIDGGRSWSDPDVVPMPTAALEISHGILALPSGRLLAPAATIEHGLLGEHVLVAISDDGGGTWPRTAIASTIQTIGSAISSRS